ncbi:hypothetical protein PTTG_08677 [Puccinia triticina 1-1 BBBD Race 1]|uniref:Integrase core domain-containing protein n=1 Tax=Puccinia triticina (isolate 1-1 / race 1 (BBBD)) TaxID=630390 RepID=A0A0C4F6B1_PUCT1|nr:hypothetical protein PTTG_08677 [Puccinia triticina 1-1 BBBD Race 1]
MHERTFTRKRREWGLQQRDLPKIKPASVITPQVRASLISSHSKGLSVAEIQARLAKETNVDVYCRTVKRYLKQLNLKLDINDVLKGKVTIPQVYEAITHAREFLGYGNAGYRRMNIILKTQYAIHVPRQMVADFLKEIDPKGTQARLRQTCKRRVFRTYGPNHIWSCDGHDKLKPYGITVYGFIDAWSQKVLGMFVHVTNNDPRHIGVYFLHLASKIGGIPSKVTVDSGTETGNMGTLIMYLSHQYASFEGRQLTVEEATARMHWTKSTRNQRIESLWSQMMKQHNRSIIGNIIDEIDGGNYDQEDQIQRSVDGYA